MNGNTPEPVVIIISILVIIWLFVWKGVALWTAVKQGQRKWFIFLLIGVLPIIFPYALGIIDITYLFFFSKKKLNLEEIKSWKKFFIRKPQIHHKD